MADNMYYNARDLLDSRLWDSNTCANCEANDRPMAFSSRHPEFQGQFTEEGLEARGMSVRGPRYLINMSVADKKS